MKTYTCECGKTFDNPQKFNGHKSNCEKHILTKYESVEQYYVNKTPKINKGAEIIKQRSELKLQQWVDEKHTCEKCGKIMTVKYGSGRFCSRSCANSRNFSEEIKNKTRNTAYKNLGIDSNNIPKKLDKRRSEEEKQKQIKDRKAALRKLHEEELNILSTHNNKILSEYQQLLLIKSAGKQETYPEKIFESAKYLATVDRTHPRACKDGLVFVHVLIAEQLLERHLTKSEVVHHVDENKQNNSFSNFYIFDSKGSHACFHYAKMFLLSIVKDTLHCVSIHTQKGLHNCITSLK